MKRIIGTLIAVALAVGMFSAVAEESVPEYTIRVHGQANLSAHQDPISVEETGHTLLATFEYKSFTGIRAVRFYVDGVRVASEKAEYTDTLGLAYTITVEIGLNTPIITIGEPVVRDFYWGPLGFFPLYDQRGGGFDQTKVPHLMGCNVLLKECYIDKVTNEEDCPLVCVEPGWEGPEPR